MKIKWEKSDIKGGTIVFCGDTKCMIVFHCDEHKGVLYGLVCFSDGCCYQFLEKDELANYLNLHNFIPEWLK